MEYILVVDENDNVIGEMDNRKCHRGAGILHRAFTAMVFNRSDKLLLTQRSDLKELWPRFWDGSVSSHVHRGESYEDATRQRLKDEIGVEVIDMEYLFKIRYQTRYENDGSENEICAAFLVRGIDRIAPNKKEIFDYRFVSLERLVEDLRMNSKKYTPWFLLILERFLQDRVKRRNL